MTIVETPLEKVRREALEELKKQIWDFFIETFENSDSFPDGQIEEFFGTVSEELRIRNLAYRVWEEAGRGQNRMQDEG